MNEKRQSRGRHIKQERIKLDQIMRVLFKLSKNLTIELINGLFNESFYGPEVKIRYGNSEFISDEYERIIGDLFITVESKHKTFHFHIEFQTLNDETMVIRMFRYGFEKALEHATSFEANNKVPREKKVFLFPKQLVIFLEENETIDDTLSLILRFSNGQELTYDVDVMKYWKHTPESLRHQRMYALLPLLVFQSRKRMRAISTSNRPEIEKRQLMIAQFGQLKGTIQQTLEVLGELHDTHQIKVGDLERILRVIQNITDYLYNRYGEYKVMEQEVNHMRKTIFDPKIRKEAKLEGKKEGKLEGIEVGKEEGKKEGKEEVAKRMLLKGLDIPSIVEFTGFTKEEVEQLQQ